MLNWRYENYTYDAKGNRLTSSVTLENTETKSYTYYVGSDRMKTDGKYVYNYDANGNMIAKGDTYSLDGDGNPEYDTAAGEYWEYVYNLFNRLTAVLKSETGTDGKFLEADYTYDADNYRVKKSSVQNGTSYYIFGQGGALLREESLEKDVNYVYVNGRHFAREVTTSEGTKNYFYATDHLGSTTMITDEAGAILWQSETTPFGEPDKGSGFLDEYGLYTGKELDEETRVVLL